MAGLEKDKDRARQGATGTGARYVLGTSLAAIVVFFAIIYLFFFGFPGGGGTERPMDPDSAPPVELDRETPDWQEPAPVQPLPQTPQQTPQQTPAP